MGIHTDAITRDEAALDILAQVGARHDIQTLAHVLYQPADGTQTLPCWIDQSWVFARHSPEIKRALAEGAVLRDAVTRIQAGLVSETYRSRGDAVAKALGVR